MSTRVSKHHRALAKLAVATLADGWCCGVDEDAFEDAIAKTFARQLGPIWLGWRNKDDHPSEVTYYKGDDNDERIFVLRAPRRPSP